MEGNLIIDDVISIYEGEFKPGYIKRTEERQCDGFCLYLEGEADYIFDGERLKVCGGDVLFLPEGGKYNIMVNKPSMHICIDFLFTKKGILPDVCRNVTGIKQEFHKFQHNWMTNSPLRIPRAFELVNRIYCRLINCGSGERLKSDGIFSRAVKEIIEHYKEASFTVESLAEKLNISTVHLRRIFSKHTDKSPLKYINDMRLDQAGKLLSASNLTVGEIALSLGFSDQFHFSKTFKAAVGLSPTDYRRSLLSTSKTEKTTQPNTNAQGGN